MLTTVILAAGKGTRMKSSLPKVLHPIASKSLVEHVIDTAKKLSDKSINLVVGHGADEVKQHISTTENINFIVQEQQLGTGHAVQQALPYLDDDSIVLILYGDVPLIKEKTLRRLISVVDEKSLGLLTVTLKDSNGYGRIVRNDMDQVIAIVEQKDASENELLIKEINTGVMAVNASHLKEWLPQLSNKNAQGEYYLTDIIALAKSQNISINTQQPAHEWEVLGVNDRRQQAELERIYQSTLAENLLLEGVTLIDPSRFDCRGELTVGNDVIIDINCIFKGNVSIGDNVKIGANCIIENTSIASGTEIKDHCILEGATLQENCIVGPFARLRPETVLAEQVKIGNFVETKKVNISKRSKVNHLSYVGDATLGEDVNIGAGTITCNYDGVNKHQTIIEDNVFVGSNSALVAPLTIESGSTIGAGSTISRLVEKETLALTRAPQKTYREWSRPTKADKKPK
ncbi:MAG: bifunctional UDP-N-acetylglucosamine pyrophosphorylase/glucosamine-1-phosphate N-acetyltransferase [Candidatus Endobugula sp.]|jgi:bifunctional UDP-N-acetylglucosamine pyrophosphorylase/glucosamine-1-phosphate N-acetyltransferase